MTFHIIGMGALGSNLAHQLIRIGIMNLVLYDFDTVESRNISNQMYYPEQIGLTKIEASKQTLLKINPEANIRLEPKGYIDQALNGIVILCLDSIETRKKIVEQNQYNFNIKLLIDTRIGLEQGQIFTIQPSTKTYPKLISTMNFKDDETDSPRNACGTALAILPTIQMTSSIATMNIIKHMKKEGINFLTVLDSLQGISKSYS